MAYKKHDILLKSAFEETFPDLLRFYFDSADVIFDMEKQFEFLDKELREIFPDPDKNGGTRFVDMLVKTFLKTGEEEWILVHIEIEGGRNQNFPHRMFQYWYRIYDRYGVDIAALAVFTGNRRQPAPARYCKEFLGTRISYEYNAYHILTHSEEQLLSMDNPFALIVLAAQKALLAGRIPEEELAEERLTIVKAMIASGKYDKERIMQFLLFLKNFLYIGDKEINRKFEEEIKLITENEINMGIVEATNIVNYERGLEEGESLQAKIGVTNMLRENFAVNKIASLLGVSIEFVEKIKASLSK
ncbi:hypothetical protein F0L74_06900 [Chitinophaga agrisoli]|uniref:Transposase/invertase (TIGR01784 family) n=1 Tax=Chitinophaga agrisoli TaxID=2607653 RepID=A0A5B2W5M5_9BACT|nr:hypothetical protein [Chitinophaga agrisoli]KAA2245677.1 hypothetical protein F0L74_06900 [Chitinophaga agrisoli]